MSINNKRAYTEYTVTQPTTDFAIGFDDFDEGGKDNILVTLNGVLVESLGYAAIRKNENTVTITPAITEGTVRLTRETDIDEPFHKFTAGALFSAKSMDENFQQVRHSQQEVRDGFVFLEHNTNGIVQASKEATAQAKAATVTATASAVRAEAAADTAVQAVGSLQSVVDAATTATTKANTATATATTAASQATAATTTAQNAASAATVAKQEATTAAANANAATVDTLAATGRANEAADVVADLVVGKVRAQDVSTTDGSTQAVKNTEFRNELDSLPFEDGVLADTFVTATARNSAMVARTQRDKNAEHVSVKDFGALGDGSAQTVINWYTLGATNYRGYANLAEVQADYPHVTSADDTIDWAACQATLNSESNKIYAPSGTYVFNKPLKTRHTGSYYRNDTGQVFYGDGVKTVFTRSDIRPATRVLSTATDLEKANADIANANECCIAVHSSHMDVFGIRISDSPLGVYMGQDHDIVEDGGASHNSFDRITFRNCGTGIIMAASQGNHYNDFSRIHFVQCQIDMHMKNGARWTGSANNNRNTFFKIRSARSRIGLWIESGDSNVLYSWHGEGCGTTANGNTFAVPVGMPDGIQSGVHVIGGQLNRVHNSQMESCQIELYNYGYNNEFYANGYHEGVANGTQVINKTPPAKFISQNSFFSQYFSVIANINPLAFPSIKRAGVPTFSGSAVYNNVAEVRQANAAHSGAEHTAGIYELGAILKDTSATTTIWANSLLPQTASFKIQVTGVSQSTNLAFVTTATAVAMRSSSSSLTRYYLVTDKAFKASGVNTGDEFDKIDLSLTVDGKDLVLNVKAPTARDLDAVSVYVDRLVCKAP